MYDTGITVQRDDLSFGHPKHRLHPVHETCLKRLPLDFGKHIPKRVLRWYPILQLQKLTKPRLFCSCHRFHPDPAIRPAQGGTHRDDKNIHPFMVTPSLYARVG